MNNNVRQQIYLAALLHDIGKFYQRASNSFGKEGDNLKEQSGKIIDYICPKNQNSQFSHQHVIWTNEFIESKKKVFESVTENNDPLFFVNPYDIDKREQDNIANLAVNHHRPWSELQKLISLADRWSSGIDRAEADEDNKTEAKGGIKFNNFKEVPLFSIFNELNKESIPVKKIFSNAFLPKELDILDVFPAEMTAENVRTLQEGYSNLWKGFIEGFDKLPKDSFRGFEESLFFLLKKYTWCIPSNTMDMADVSLFDHLKTTAAIADCLYVAKNDDAYRTSIKFNGASPNVENGTYPLMLLGVDISGIQTFIYDIASSRAAKSLKGRSFYLQLLAEAILMKFKKHPDIQAKSAHVLYASGGKFYMILPNIQKVHKAIESINSEVEKELWQQHKGRLSVNMAYTGFAHHSKKENDKWVSWIEIERNTKERCLLSDLWKDLSDKITEKKEKKFKGLLLSDFNKFFDEKDESLRTGGKTEICIVTGDEISDSEKVPYNKNEVEEDKDKEKKYSTKAVSEQTELGNALKDVDYLIAFKGNVEDDKYLNNRAKAKITVLDTNFYLFDKIELIDNKADFRNITSADISGIYMINGFNFLAPQIKGHKVSYGFQFYGGNGQAYLRDENGNIKYRKKVRVEKEHQYKIEKTFEDLSRGQLLGVLRMDVDNLGKLFIKGFKPERMTFSAFATLSFHFDWFFSGYLNTIRNSEDFKDWVNILYSGGDDLFVVGKWDRVIGFAEKVRKDFENYTGRKDIGISGGITFVHDKFPISKAAQMAGEAESASKKHSTEKNAITFLGETVSWKEEFECVKKIKEDFIHLIDKQKASKAILHKLMLYKYHKDKEDISYLWNAAYYLKRYKERYGKNEFFQTYIEELTKRIFEGDKDKNISGKRYLDLVALAARWAELELKYLKKDENEDCK